MASSDKVPPAKAAPVEDVPGAGTGMLSRMLAGTTEMIQSFKPINHMQLHIQTFNFVAHDLTRQLETHYYCSIVNSEVLQALIFDSENSDARVIGAAFFVSDRIFASLPEEDKKLWHSLFYAVKSGQMYFPGLPESAERSWLKKLAKMYGKAWLFWQYDRGDRLPLGTPALLGAFVKDGEIRPQLVEERDKGYLIHTLEKAKARQDIEGPVAIDPAANSWKSGKGLVTELSERPLEFTGSQAAPRKGA